MSHEPECPVAGVEPTAYDYAERVYYECICDRLRAAYRRGYGQGRADGKATVHDCGAHSAMCCSASYRAGYNDHARAQQHWQDTHGAYRQHGEGTNP